MKTLSLVRPLILIIVGLPGAGKTFFARQFSHMFSAPLVSIDRMRFELFGDPQYSAAEQALLQRIGDYQLGEIVKTKCSFIVDGYCNSKLQRKKIAAFAKQNGYDTLVVWIQTEPTTTEARAIKRNPKRPDDAYNYSLTREQFQLLSKQFTPPRDEAYVVVSGRHTFATQAKMVLRKLTSAHAEAAKLAHAKTIRVERELPEQPTRAAQSRPRSVVIR